MKTRFVNVPEGKAIRIQVKTTLEEEAKYVFFGHKNQIVDDLFYAFVKLNNYKDLQEFWIVPSKELVEYYNHITELYHSTPKKDGTPKKPGRPKFYLYENKETLEGWSEKLKKYYMNIEGLRR